MRSLANGRNEPALGTRGRRGRRGRRAPDVRRNLGNRFRAGPLTRPTSKIIPCASHCGVAGVPAPLSPAPNLIRIGGHLVENWAACGFVLERRINGALLFGPSIFSVRSDGQRPRAWRTKKVTRLPNINTASAHVYNACTRTRPAEGEQINPRARPAIVFVSSEPVERFSMTFEEKTRRVHSAEEAIDSLSPLLFPPSRSPARLLSEHRKAGRPGEVDVSREKTHSQRCRTTDPPRHALINPLNVIWRGAIRGAKTIT